MNRRKLEAEAVRDAVLAVAGKLDPTMGGPAVPATSWSSIPSTRRTTSTSSHDPDDPKTFRRAVYRFLVRSKPQPFMTVLDCADPSMQVDRRNETVSPLQALALYNNGFMLTMAEHLAARVERAGGPGGAGRRRVPAGPRPRRRRPAEREALAAYAREHGLANACRVILNLNEFVFVD